ncbi:thioredoxin [Prevotella sp. oral taxon 376]|uniref:thioredoxin n=1 Tax=Prevotella sp. oral taxon 376 TaxID=712466 RepID=UPI000D1E4D6B|nr:thioredoxin [Prevotella sp. oral taxon 376]PTL32666.1 thioredoxin [Prevotella sp. oral taxon 376]
MKVRNILALMLFAGIFTSSCSNKNANQKIAQTSPDSVSDKKQNTMEMTLEMFNERIMDMKNNPNKWAYKGTRPAIIDFYATWCGPCKITAPILDSLAFEYKGKLEVYKVDVDKQRELASMFGIESIPSLLFIPIKGQPLMQVGAMGRADLEKIIKEKLLK